MMKVMRLASAMLYVKDLPRMRDFYQAMFGAEPLPSEWPDIWAQFDAGGAHFALHAIPEEIARGIEIASPPEPRVKCPVKLTFEVADVLAERARLAALGIQLIQRAWQEMGDSCEAIDPEGNIIQLSRAARN